MDRYRDGRYLTSNPHWHDLDGPWKADHIVSLLRDAGVVPKSVCDVGCGSAGVLAALRPLLPEAQLVGFEVSPQAAGLGARLHAEIELRQDDIVACGERFDVVLLLDVLEHVEDYLGFLRSLSKSGERFIFHIPLDMAAQLVVRSKTLVHKRENVGHLHYFSKDTALATLDTAGYRVDSWRYTAGTIDSPSRSWKMRLISAPRRIGARLAPDLTSNVLGGFSLLVLATPKTEPSK